jgi:hypothetical protein
VLASIDQVPDELIDNAIVLGCLSFFVAFVFLIDMSERMAKRRTDATQTDSNSIDRHYSKSLSMTTISSQANLIDSDETNKRNRESMRSNHHTQTDANNQQSQQSSSAPFVNSQNIHEQRQPTYNGNAQPSNMTEYQHDQGFHSQPHSTHSAQQIPVSTYVEDVVETQTLPKAQVPVFSKVKQAPTLLNHFESEPYKKILSRSNHQQSHTRYHDQAQHNNDPTFYDDFNSYRRQTYYQGPKVDQEKFVIRDYSHQPPQHQHKQSTCNCQNHQCSEKEGQEQESAAMKAGYVSQVAKLWDSRVKTIEGPSKSHPKNIKGLNTVV